MKRGVQGFFLLFLSVLFLGASVVIAWKGYQKNQENEQVSQEVRQLQEEAQELEEETRKLSDRIAYLRTPEYVEREVKERFNLKNPNESVAVIESERIAETSEPEGLIASHPSGEVRGAEDGGAVRRNSGRWWGYFFAPRNP